MGHQFLWMDLETTGVNPREGVILEVAAVLATDDQKDVRPVYEYTAVIGHSKEELFRLEIDSVVLGMHHRNGLWLESMQSPVTLEEVDTALTLMSTNFEGKVVLAGNSVHFDRNWCVEHFPRFSKTLHHRVYDTSTVKRYMDINAQIAGYEPFNWPKAEKHRALDDVLESLRIETLARNTMV